MQNQGTPKAAPFQHQSCLTVMLLAQSLGAKKGRKQTLVFSSLPQALKEGVGRAGQVRGPGTSCPFQWISGQAVGLCLFISIRSSIIPYSPLCCLRVYGSAGWTVRGDEEGRSFGKPECWPRNKPRGRCWQSRRLWQAGVMGAGVRPGCACLGGCELARALQGFALRARVPGWLCPKL